MNDFRAEFAQHFDVSRETLEKLELYEALLRKWTKRINLVAPGTLDALWQRHFTDSAQILRLAAASASSWADLGSGGGFPGAIIAILASSTGQGIQMTLIESDQRKAAFLRAVARETKTPFSVIAERIETSEPVGADVVTARALAPLDTLLGYVVRHVAANGTALLPKGANAVSELEKARKTWSFTCESTQSMTDPQAAILKIGEIQRV
ncbi:MAG: 16S rRNA (guanine(527)-N(7))-methyltransferase RsmG [Boseongicola sp.]|nr:16S rRNA (guanine(527)-N(7))-methyltransferase RsmG [Boseongicola sp.]